MTTVRISRSWCHKMAVLEGDAAIGAGSPNYPLRDLLTPEDCHMTEDDVASEIKKAVLEERDRGANIFESALDLLQKDFETKISYYRIRRDHGS